jgi:serine/threonine protein phosphatase 1
MRHLAIGDIHGCSRALDALLALVEPRPDDLIVTLGDYVDLGPDSKGVLDRLAELERTHKLVAVLGDHDQMLLDARNDATCDWFPSFGAATLRSYGPESAFMSLVPTEHWEFLERCAHYHETDTHVFVHANADAKLAMEWQTTYMLRWEFLRAETSRPLRSGKTLVCGHTQQKSGDVLNLGHAICVDTFAHGGGWLTCLDVLSGRVWQARESGETRLGSIDDV